MKTLQRITMVGAVLGAVLACPSCSSVSNAPKGSPRIEVAVAVELAPAFRDRLDASPEELAETFDALVMKQGDVGLRFYPVLSSAYGPEDPRPDYVLTVTMDRLDVTLDEREVKQPDAEPDAEPIKEMVATQIRCVATASLERRRATGPSLSVGSAEGVGTSGVSRSADSDVGWTLVHEQSAEHPVTVWRRDVSKAVALAVERALGGLVRPIDRELSLRASSADKTDADDR